MQTTMLWIDGRVLDHDHVLALTAGIAKFGDGGCGIGQKPGFVGGIGPGPRHDTRAVPRADLVFVVFDDRIQRGGIDKALFNQQGFERLDPQRRVAGNGAVIVGMFMVMIMAVGIVGTHDASLLNHSICQERTLWPPHRARVRHASVVHRRNLHPVPAERNAC